MGDNAIFPSVPITRFDTSLIDPKDRYDAWDQNMGVLFDTSTADRKALASDIDAQINASHLGEALFGTTLSSSQLFERAEPRVARDALDHILVQVFVKGGTIVDGEHKLDQGDILIMDLDKPHRQLNSEFEVLTLVLPRELDTKLSEMLAPLHGKKLAGQNPMAGFIGDHMKAFWRHIPHMNTGQANAALHGTLGLIKGWLEQDELLDEGGPSEVSMELGKSVRRYIDVHLSDPLTPAELTTIFRISRTYLYRLFAEDGGVMAYITERRLRLALRMLTQPSYAGQSIGAIGFNCGFSSESYFSRSFRSRFGVTPSEARLLGAEETAQQDWHSTDTRADNYLLPRWIHDLGE